jgi:hypothetical protein
MSISANAREERTMTNLRMTTTSGTDTVLDEATVQGFMTLRKNVPFEKRPDTVGQPQSAENCASRMPSWKAQAHRVFEAASTTVSRGNRLTNSIGWFLETMSRTH